MKIAFIGQKGIPSQNGGVERYVESLAINLVQMGQEVLVYSRNDYSPEKLSEFKGIQVINKPYINNKNLASITNTFLATLDVLGRQVDIVHFQGIGPSLLCWIPKIFKPRVKVVATLHSFDYCNDKWSWFAKKMLYLGEKTMCHFADEVIVLSEAMQKHVVELHGRNAILIPNGADLYDQVGENKILAWGLERNSYFLSVSRAIRLKGLQYLIAAFRGLKTDKKLVIVGDGEYLPELKRLAAGDERIIFTGNQIGRTLDQLYFNACLFIQSSELEGMSLSLLEAMAHKQACLVSDIEANKRTIEDTGFTFASKDVNDLQQKMQYILDHESEANLKAEASYNRIAQGFTWTKLAAEVLETYQK